MNQMTRDELHARWPELVGVDCAEGWFSVIDACLMAARDAGYDAARERVVVRCVRKDSLQVYVNCIGLSESDAIRAERIQGAIDKANTSAITCERCGEFGSIKMFGGYLPPHCDALDCPAGPKSSDQKHDESDRQVLSSAEELPVSSMRPSPPRGYSSWLDYAVDTFDTRSAEIERLFDDEDSGNVSTREGMRLAAKGELEELRKEAGSRRDRAPEFALPSVEREQHMTYAELKARWPELPEIECHEGWCGVIDACLQAAKDVGYDSAIDEVRQIKEKFGTLRVYIHCSSSLKDAGERAKRIYEAIEKANRSARTCEVCGAPGKLMLADSFYMTRCHVHTPENARSIRTLLDRSS